MLSARRLRPVDWLKGAGAQGDVVDALSRFDDWRSLYEGCPRGDWLLGIADRIGVDHVALVRAAIGCARVATGDDERTAMLDVCERWTEGRATDEDVAAVTRTLEAASTRAFDPASEAACRAALAVALGISDRGVLTGAPAAAAESVMVSSMDCGFELAMRWAHDRCAAAVRAAVPWAAFEARLSAIAL